MDRAPACPPKVKFIAHALLQKNCRYSSNCPTNGYNIVVKNNLLILYLCTLNCVRWRSNVPCTAQQPTRRGTPKLQKMARRKKASNSDELPKAKVTASALKKASKLFSYSKGHRWKFAVGLVFLLLTGATALAFPKILGLLVDSAQAKDLPRANQLAIGLFVILLLQSLCSYFRVYLFVNFTENTLANLRSALYQRLMRLPMSFYAQNRVGELNSRISADIAQIQDTLTTTIAEFLRQFILIIGGITLLTIISYKLTLLMLGIVPVVAVAAVFFGRFIRSYARKTQDLVAESQVIVEETLQGIANVKAFANEYFEQLRYGRKVHETAQVAIQGGKYRGYFASFIIFCLFGAIVGVVWFGVYLIITGQLTDIGQLISFVLYSIFVGASFGGIAELYAQIQKALGATQRVFELLEEPTEEVNIAHAPTALNLQGQVEFKDVVFAYPTRKDLTVVNGVSFTMHPGQKIALVGASGAGKSTIAQLLLQFYRSEDGQILIDGQPIQSYDLSDLRASMSWVPQDVLLFGGTIQENIAYGKPDATDAEIRTAAQQANALEFIERFPDGMQTVVGERGVQLSGGQRQRIAIARALLKNPKILVLDEATSALDSESEKAVQAALDLLMQGRTSLIIAHRLSTIRHADQILVLEHGKIVEAGTHEELNQKENGVYRHLSALQFTT